MIGGCLKEIFMFKLSTLALVLASAFAAPAFASCPDALTSVTFGTYDSGVSNRAVAGTCTIDDQIFDDEQQWGSQASFLSHVSTVTFNLLKQAKISAAERVKLMAAAQASGIGNSIKVKLISFNDFHGYIKAGEGSSSNPGVARLSTRIKALRAQNNLNAVVTAGDLIGASPLTSALFKDEPTIEAMNRIGIDFSAVGNHEFDEGKDELLRMKHGGNHATDPFTGYGLPQDLKDNEFAGAKFDFLAANVVDTAAGSPLLPAYGVKNFLGNKVAFIGMTLEATPTIVSPSGVAGLEFRDEADTVNTLIPTLQAQGIKSVVVLIHEGGFDTTSAINDCTGISGPIVDIVNRLDPEVDLVISGHTHAAYNCLINNKAGKPVRVTSAGQYGRNLTDTDLVIDTRSKDVISVAATVLATGTATTVPPTAEDAALTDLVAHYDASAAVPAGRVIGKITAGITKTNNAAGESALGDVIADAQLAATASAATGGAVIAMMNPGGIRADLPYNQASAGFAYDGTVTYGNAFTVQPFGNSLVTLTLTGAQIRTALETQFVGCNGQTQERILQISNGFSYAYTAANACNARVTSLTLNGLPVDPLASYRVTVNSFLADGGDGFVVLKNGTNRLGGEVDTDAFEKYLQANPTGVAPGAQNRIVKN